MVQHVVFLDFPHRQPSPAERTHQAAHQLLDLGELGPDATG
jgi:hypothetical protein